MVCQQKKASHCRTQQRRTLLDVSPRTQQVQKEAKQTPPPGTKFGTTNVTPSRHVPQIGKHASRQSGRIHDSNDVTNGSQTSLGTTSNELSIAPKTLLSTA